DYSRCALTLRVALKGDRRRCATSSNPAFLCRGFDPIANRHRMALDNFLCPTGHIGNTFSEHMGNTFGHLRETRNALEGVIQDGRADALCGPVDGGREDGGVVPRVRYLAQDRLQTLQPVQRLWGRGLDRSEPPAVSARQSPAFSDREPDPAAQREALELGSTKDPGQDQAAV